MININPEDGQRDPQTLRTLAKYRKDERSQILFGQYLSYEPLTQQRVHQLCPPSRILLRADSICKIKRQEGTGREEKEEEGGNNSS